MKFSPQGHNDGIFFGFHPYRIARPSRNSVFLIEYSFKGLGVEPTGCRFLRRQLYSLELIFRGVLFHFMYFPSLSFSSFVAHLTRCCEFSAVMGSALYRESPRYLDGLSFFLLYSGRVMWRPPLRTARENKIISVVVTLFLPVSDGNEFSLTKNHYGSNYSNFQVVCHSSQRLMLADSVSYFYARFSDLTKQ